MVETMWLCVALGAIAFIGVTKSGFEAALG